MLGHLMTWNPTSKKQGEEVVMASIISYTTINNKKYLKNDSISRRDLLLQDMDFINM